MSDESTHLPPELDWEQMEVGILGKMDELNHDLPKPNNKKPKRIISTIAVLITFLLLINYCNFSSNEDEMITYFPVILPSNINEDKINNTPETETTVNAYLEPSSKKVAGKKIVSTEAGHSFNKNFSISYFNEEKNNSISGAIGPSNYNMIPNTIKINHSSFVDKKENRFLEKDEVSGNQVEGVKFEEENESATAAFITSKGFGEITLIQQDRFSIERKYEKERISHLKHPLEKRIQLTSGITFWDMGYGKNKPDRNEFENTRLSYHAGLNYIHTLKNNYIFSVGFQYQQLENRFFQSSIEEEIITLSDTIVEIRTNVLTGESTNIYGDVDLLTEVEYLVRHYNRTNLYQIPFAVGKTWSKNRWQADILLGGSVNVFTTNKGRTFYDGELEFYNGSNTGFISNQWAFNAMARGQFTYYINNQLGLTSGFQIQKSVTNWSQENGVKMRPQWMGLELGLSMKL